MQQQSPSRFKAWLPTGLILLAGLLAYLNTLPNAFIFDDEPWILHNERIRSLSNVDELLTATNRPLMDLSFAVNYALGETNPAGYHLFNLIIHALAGLTLYGLIRRTLNLPALRDVYGRYARGVACVIALLWLLHPLNTQAVTYTVQRGESMMGLFYLLTLYCFVRFTTGGGKLWAVGSVLACLLGVGCKEVIATAPLVVLLYDWTFLKQSLREMLRERWPVYLGLFATWVPLAWFVMRTLGSGEDASAGFALEDKLLTRWTYLLTQPGVIVEVYLRKAFWPNPLVLDYQWRPAIPGDTPDSAVMRLFMQNVLWQGLVVVGLLCLSLFGVMKRRWWGFLGLSFFLILAPTSSLMPIADLAVEHRMYLSLIAVVCFVVLAVFAVLRRGLPGDKPLTYGLVLSVILCLTLAMLTIARNADYRTKISIWDSVVLAQPLNPRGWHNLGSALDAQGRTDEAMACYEQVLKIVPSYAAAHYGIGTIWLERGNMPMAIERFEKAIELNPNDTAAHAHLGKALLLSGRLEQARSSLEKAIGLGPTYARAYEYLGLFHLAQQDLPGAIKSFRLAVEHDPKLVAPHQNLAVALSQSGKPGEAADVLDRALKQASQIGLTEQQQQSFRDKRDRYRAQALQGSVGP